jgi:hypothetical protein
VNREASVLDDCFKRIAEKPAVLPFHVEDPLASDLKGILPHIQTSAARQLYILAKVSELAQLSIPEYPMEFLELK